MLVHLPIHASWLNEGEVCFSIVQRKALTPNDFASLEDLAGRLEVQPQRPRRTAELLLQMKPFREKARDVLAALAMAWERSYRPISATPVILRSSTR